MTSVRCTTVSLLCLAIACSSAAAARTEPDQAPPSPVIQTDMPPSGEIPVPGDMPPPSEAPPPIQTGTPAPAAPGGGGIKSYPAADFARFSPKTAYDMLSQVPSFTIVSLSDQRGLGQASENVLINGLRVTDKSGGAIAQLQKVPAGDVLRIEVKDAATLGIAGLTGQVADVILKEDRKASGNFNWSPRFRPKYARAGWLGGSISYAGTTGKLAYTLSLENNEGRGADGGPDYQILSPAGAVTENRDTRQWNNFDQARFSTILKYGGNGPVQADLNLVYSPFWNYGDNFERRVPTDGDANNWDFHRDGFGFSYFANGDLSFPLGGGRLKFIGSRSFTHSPNFFDQLTVYDSGAPATGTLYTQDAKTSETIGRAEYHWKDGANDWTVSFERAYNRLAQVSTLANLESDGSYTDIPYPQGSGIVAETRYEGIASLSRPLSARLDLQLAGGAEYSTLGHVDLTVPPHHYFRPKGSVLLAWRPAKGWDASLKFERRVGQISFSDFLANTDLTNNRANDANPNLVPPQSWEVTGEIGRSLGDWGKTRLKLYQYWVQDIVDHIPVGTDGDAVGNLPNATRLGIESISTLQFDPLGLKGAKLDIDVGLERARVRDPLTQALRQISNTRDSWAHLAFRHDIPGTKLAWGAGLDVDHYSPSFYLTEINQGWEGPYLSMFIADKNLAGFDVSLGIFNLNYESFHWRRQVFEGRRNTTPVSFYERQEGEVEPIFTLAIKGTF